MYEWSCTSTSPLCIRGLDRDKFTFAEILFASGGAAGFFFCRPGPVITTGALTEIIHFSKSQLGVFIDLPYLRPSNLEFLKSWKSISSFKISILPPSLLPFRFCSPGRLHHSPPQLHPCSGGLGYKSGLVHWLFRLLYLVHPVLTGKWQVTITN